MAFLVKLSTLISRLCQLIGGISLIIIVLVTMLDVIARYIFKLTGGEFGFTVKGSVEIVSYFMLFALLGAFAAFVERSQIIVDVFTQKMSKAVNDPIRISTDDLAYLISSKILIGWSGLKDKNGNDVPFSQLNAFNSLANDFNFLDLVSKLCFERSNFV